MRDHKINNFKYFSKKAIVCHYLICAVELDINSLSVNCSRSNEVPVLLFDVVLPWGLPSFGLLSEMKSETIYKRVKFEHQHNSTLTVKWHPSKRGVWADQLTLCFLWIIRSFACLRCCTNLHFYIEKLCVFKINWVSLDLFFLICECVDASKRHENDHA